MAALCIPEAVSAALEQVVASTNHESAWPLHISGPGDAHLSTIADQEPHVVVVDYRNCGSCGKKCIRRLHARLPSLPFLLVRDDSERMDLPPELPPAIAAFAAARSSPDELKRSLVRLIKGPQTLLHSRLRRIQDWEGLSKKAHYDPATMAALCSVSLRQLERFFKLRWGETPRCWLLHLRCRIARQLLEQGYSSNAVVAELHFAGIPHLCHAFNRIYKRAPQSFAPIPPSTIKKSL